MKYKEGLYKILQRNLPNCSDGFRVNYSGNNEISFIVSDKIYKMIQSYRRKFPRIIKTTAINRLRNRRRKLK